MNKSMLTGVVAGIAVAMAGGVAGYAFFGTAAEHEPTEPASAAVADVHGEAPQTSQPKPQAAPPAPVEECWDEEVTVQADPRDDKAIAGTAIGAVVGGAIAKNVGDDRDLATAAGAAAGAFAGRKLQRRYQENNTTTTIERRCAPAGTR
jgi:uncharacterized protein YcfJ